GQVARTPLPSPPSPHIVLERDVVYEQPGGAGALATGNGSAIGKMGGADTLGWGSVEGSSASRRVSRAVRRYVRRAGLAVLAVCWRGPTGGPCEHRRLRPFVRGWAAWSGWQTGDASGRRRRRTLGVLPDRSLGGLASGALVWREDRP